MCCSCSAITCKQQANKVCQHFEKNDEPFRQNIFQFQISHGSMSLGVHLYNVVDVGSEEVVLVDAPVRFDCITECSRSLVLGKIVVVDNEELRRNRGFAIDNAAVDKGNATVDRATQSQAAVYHGEERGLDNIAQHSGVAIGIESHFNGVDLNARNSSFAVHQLMSDIHTQLVAVTPTAIVFDDGITERLECGTVAKSQRADSNVGFRDVVIAKLNMNSGQFATGDLVGSYQTATLTSLRAGEINRVGIEVCTHEHVVVRPRGRLVLERWMQSATESGIQVDKVCPLHSVIHLFERADRHCFLFEFLFCHSLTVQAGKSPVTG